MVPKSGASIIAPEWIASENDIANDPFLKGNLVNPSPANPTVKTLRSKLNSSKNGGRDWDIVTPPGSPTHFDEFCAISGIEAKSENKERFPLLQPSAPGLLVVPFRFVSNFEA